MTDVIARSRAPSVSAPSVFGAVRPRRRAKRWLHHVPTRTPSQVVFDIVDSTAGLANLSVEWGELLRSNNVQQLGFQSHAWLMAWAKAYRPAVSRGSQIAIVTGRRGGRLCVVCPLAVCGNFGIRTLGWLGEPASQYGDVVSDGNAGSQEMINAALQFAIGRLKPDIVHLRKVRADAAIQGWLRGADATTVQIDAAPYLDFSAAAGADDYSNRYSAKARKNRRRLRRRLNEEGVVVTTVLTPGAEAAAAVRIGLAFKQQWLAARGHISLAMRDDALVDFATRFVAEDNGEARPFVSIMHAGETPVSVQFGIVANGRLAMHMIAYNAETEKSGAGVLHIEDTITHCIENGINELDLLAPDAAYKRAWADGVRPVGDYFVARTLKGRVWANVYLMTIRGALKSGLERLPLGLRCRIARLLQR